MQFLSIPPHYSGKSDNIFVLRAPEISENIILFFRNAVEQSDDVIWKSKANTHLSEN